MKSLLLTLSLLLITACGFHPVYGVNKYTPIGAETKFQQISISNIPDRNGQYLRNALIDRLYRDGRATDPVYSLTVAPIRETQRNLDVTIDSDTTRAQLKISTNISLINTATRETLFKRAISSTASYNVLGSEFTNRVSEQSTRENILDDVARQIEMQISLYFKQ